MTTKDEQSPPVPAAQDDGKDTFVALSRMPAKADLEGAQAELERELLVRDRCYGRWVNEGRLAKSDARDRYTRLQAALACVKAVLDYFPQDEVGVPYGTGTGNEG